MRISDWSSDVCFSDLACYLLIPHVTSRIDRFLTGGGDTYQIDRALDALRAGGLFGAGPGEGAMKLKLPEPHTDYIFAVIGEEFGAIACLALASLFIAIVVRVTIRLLDEEDPFLLRSEEHTSELQSLMRISYAVYCLK